MSLVSFVIPSYNCANYVTEAIDSIYQLNMPLDIFEVIVVDDGSRDNTIEVLSDINKPNFSYYSIPNSGAGIARNYGLSKSISKYIQFVDADDTLIKCDPKELVNILSNYDFDILDLRLYHTTDVNNDVLTIDNCDCLTGIEHIIKHPIHSSPVKHIFRRKFIVDNNLMFSGLLGGGEDIDHTVLSFFKASSTLYLPWGWYYVRPREGSLTRSNSLKIQYNICTIVLNLISFFRQQEPFCNIKEFRDNIISYLLALFKMQEIFLYSRSIPLKQILNFYTDTQFEIKEILGVCPNVDRKADNDILRYLRMRSYSPYLSLIYTSLKRLFFKIRRKA